MLLLSYCMNTDFWKLFLAILPYLKFVLYCVYENDNHEDVAAQKIVQCIIFFV